MEQTQLNWIANFIWGIADDVLRDLRARAGQQQLKADFEAWLDGFSPNVLKLIFLPIAGEIESGTDLLYDGACGTGGMLTVEEETLEEKRAEYGSQIVSALGDNWNRSSAAASQRRISGAWSSSPRSSRTVRLSYH